MRCTITVKSSTFAMKGARLLKQNNIFAETVKIDPNLTREGCSFGITFDCERTNEVKRLFDSRGIGYGYIIGGGLR